MLSPLTAFGAGDLVVAVVIAAAGIILLRTRLEALARRFAERTGLCMLALAVLPIALRLALLRHSPVPTPDGADDFAYVLLADTLRHFRLANPMHPMRQFFEAVFILQEPAYSSIFPLGQGLALAFGWVVFGHPWGGVLLSGGAFSALCYWMLRGWVSPGWALAGGLLAVFEFGPLCQWTNLYWGGFVSAVAGCLVFGAIPRLDSRSRRPALLLGAGLALQLLARPFEFVLLIVCVVPFLWKQWRRAGLTAIVLLTAVGLTLLHDHAVTRSWLTTPYQLSQWEYGVPARFTVQPNPEPHRELTPEQELDYRAQSIVHGDGPDTLVTYGRRWVERLRFYRFFFYLALFPALAAFVFALRERRYRWVLGTVAVFSLGTNFYPYFYPHYIAALTCLFVLIAVAGLQRLSRWRLVPSVILGVCAAEFVFWYGLHAFAPDPILNGLGRYEAWDFLNHGDADGRIAINRQLAQSSGRQLVFVRYSPQHEFREWIHNDADIDRAHVVWAADMGTDINEILRHYYPDRTVWLVEPDRDPPTMALYPVPAPPPPAPEPQTAAPPAPLRFDDGAVNNPGAVQEMRRKK